MWQLFFALLLALPQAQAPHDISTAASATPTGHPILALGSPAPDFSLPGVDGKTHELSGLRRCSDFGRRFHLQPLPDRANVRAAHSAARRPTITIAASRS